MKNIRTSAALYALIVLFSLNGCKKDSNCKEYPIPGCIVTFDYNPVCGCNGKTYSNPSEAECDGIKDYKEGKCWP